jgi:hypothetical protein
LNSEESRKDFETLAGKVDVVWEEQFCSVSYSALWVDDHSDMVGLAAGYEEVVE